MLEEYTCQRQEREQEKKRLRVYMHSYIFFIIGIK